MFKKSIVSGFIAMSAVVAASPAMAATKAVSTDFVHMRSAPSAHAVSRGVIPAGAPMRVKHCMAERPWCAVSYANKAGWASARYIEARDPSMIRVVDNRAPAKAGAAAPAGAMVTKKTVTKTRKTYHRHAPAPVKTVKEPKVVERVVYVHKAPVVTSYRPVSYQPVASAVPASWPNAPYEPVYSAHNNFGANPVEGVIRAVAAPFEAAAHVVAAPFESMARHSADATVSHVPVRQVTVSAPSHVRPVRRVVVETQSAPVYVKERDAIRMSWGQYKAAKAAMHRYGTMPMTVPVAGSPVSTVPETSTDIYAPNAFAKDFTREYVAYHPSSRAASVHVVPTSSRYEMREAQKTRIRYSPNGMRRPMMSSYHHVADYNPGHPHSVVHGTDFHRSETRYAVM